jgi:enamine deaminase RidA (YjgF/YER057c/UK114 family)
MVKRYDVDGVVSPGGRYSHVAETEPGARFYHLAGRTGIHPDGTIGKDFKEQAELVYANLKQILKECGMTFDNLVKTTVFLVDPEDKLTHREVQRKALGDVVPPNTLLIVNGLALPELLIEVDAIAAKD